VSHEWSECKATLSGYIELFLCIDAVFWRVVAVARMGTAEWTFPPRRGRTLYRSLSSDYWLTLSLLRSKH
jgi:hypothetical protein